MAQYFSKPFPKPDRNVFTLLCIIDIRLINSSHENEEDKEDVEDEVHRPEEGVGVLDGGKVEVAEDEAELGEAGVRDGVKVLDLEVRFSICSICVRFFD